MQRACRAEGLVGGIVLEGRQDFDHNSVRTSIVEVSRHFGPLCPPGHLGQPSQPEYPVRTSVCSYVRMSVCCLSAISLHTPALSRQLSAICCQPAAIRHRPSTISLQPQPSVASREPSAVSWQPSAASCWKGRGRIPRNPGSPNKRAQIRPQLVQVGQIWPQAGPSSPQVGPRPSQDGPRPGQEGPKLGQVGPKTGPRWAKFAPSWGQVRSNLPPNRPQASPAWATAARGS